MGTGIAARATGLDERAKSPEDGATLRDIMSLIRTHSRLVRASVIRQIRSLATHDTSEPTASKKTTFTATLAGGPSLSDFFHGEVPERVVLGNKNRYVVSLPEG